MSKEKKQVVIGSGDDKKEFVLQHPGIKWCLDHDYNSRDRNGNIKTNDFIQGILDNVVVDPKGFKVDDFGSMQEVTEFQEAVQNFL